MGSLLPYIQNDDCHRGQRRAEDMTWANDARDQPQQLPCLLSASSSRQAPLMRWTPPIAFAHHTELCVRRSSSASSNTRRLPRTQTRRSNMGRLTSEGMFLQPADPLQRLPEHLGRLLDMSKSGSASAARARTESRAHAVCRSSQTVDVCSFARGGWCFCGGAGRRTRAGIIWQGTTH